MLFSIPGEVSTGPGGTYRTPAGGSSAEGLPVTGAGSRAITLFSLAIGGIAAFAPSCIYRLFPFALDRRGAVHPPRARRPAYTRPRGTACSPLCVRRELRRGGGEARALATRNLSRRHTTSTSLSRHTRRTYNWKYSKARADRARLIEMEREVHAYAYASRHLRRPSGAAPSPSTRRVPSSHGALRILSGATRSPRVAPSMLLAS